MPSDVKAIVEAGTSYRILSHQLQLPQNVLAILPEPCGNPTVADPIAMQLMTELEAPDEGQTQFQKSQPAIDTAMAEDIQIPTCSKYLNEEIKSSPNDNITDENLSPNKPAKRINDPGYQQSSKKQATSLLKFRTFEINWNKLGDNLLERLGDLQEFISQNPESAVPRSIRFKKTEMTSLVNNIVDQMRCVDNNIRADTTETVAKQILGKYPCLEILDDDGFSNGLSHITIKHKLINRNTYLNRLNNQANTTTLTPVAKNKRAGTNQEYWKATTNHCTKEVMAKLRRDEPTLLTDEFLVESQGFVRSRMDQKRDLALIMSEFPVFRRRRLLNHHFKEATGTDIEMLRKYFNSKKSKIILYSTTQKLNKLSEKPSDRDVFYFLAKLLDETLDDLILKKEVVIYLKFDNFKIKKSLMFQIGTRIDEIRDEAAAPVLIAIGKLIKVLELIEICKRK